MELHNATQAITWLENKKSKTGFWNEKWGTGEVWKPAQSNNALEKKAVQISMVGKLRQYTVVKGKEWSSKIQCAKYVAYK